MHTIACLLVLASPFLLCGLIWLFGTDLQTRRGGF